MLRLLGQALIRLISIPFIHWKLRQFSKEVQNDPELSAQLEEIRKNYAEIESKMDFFCKYRPNSTLCKQWREKRSLS